MEQQKTITVGQIAKCYRLYLGIFEEEDQDYPDGRVVANKENAIERLLRKMVGDDERILDQARDIVERLRANDDEDMSWKPLCDAFRRLGFKVVDGDAKGNPAPEFKNGSFADVPPAKAPDRVTEADAKRWRRAACRFEKGGLKNDA